MTAYKHRDDPVLDVAVFSDELLAELGTMDPAQVSAWRERGGQVFLPVESASTSASRLNVLTAPSLGDIPAGALPGSVSDASMWLMGAIDRTRCALDDGAGGAPEGIVIRTADRSRIAKLRFDDYRRTLRTKA